MAVRDIVIMGAPSLLEKSLPVDDIQSSAVRDLLEDLKDTQKANDGLGIPSVPAHFAQPGQICAVFPIRSPSPVECCRWTTRTDANPLRISSLPARGQLASKTLRVCKPIPIESKLRIS